jgi:predicted transcriptional regulator of viral defense system
MPPPVSPSSLTPADRAKAVFRDHGGVMRTTEALEAGVHPRDLYGLRDAGDLVELARGVYRLAEMEPMAQPDLATVCKRVPHGVICLISALAYHELTTQIPHAVDVAVPRNGRAPRLDYPPLRVYRFSEAAYETGVETRDTDGVELRVYEPEKTLADAFKYRNKIGLDVALEALRMYRSRRGARFQRVLEHARTCRVERVMRPYLEAVL